MAVVTVEVAVITAIAVVHFGGVLVAASEEVPKMPGLLGGGAESPFPRLLATMASDVKLTASVRARGPGAVDVYQYAVFAVACILARACARFGHR